MSQRSTPYTNYNPSLTLAWCVLDFVCLHILSILTNLLHLEVQHAFYHVSQYKEDNFSQKQYSLSLEVFISLFLVKIFDLQVPLVWYLYSLMTKILQEKQQCTNYWYKGGNQCQVKASSCLHMYHETNHVHCNFYFCLHIWKNFTCSQLNFRINRKTWIQIRGDACLTYSGFQVPYLENQSNYNGLKPAVLGHNILEHID